MSKNLINIQSQSDYLELFLFTKCICPEILIPETILVKEKKFGAWIKYVQKDSAIVKSGLISVNQGEISSKQICSQFLNISASEQIKLEFFTKTDEHFKTFVPKCIIKGSSGKKDLIDLKDIYDIVNKNSDTVRYIQKILPFNRSNSIYSNPVYCCKIVQDNQDSQKTFSFKIRFKEFKNPQDNICSDKYIPIEQRQKLVAFHPSLLKDYPTKLMKSTITQDKSSHKINNELMQTVMNDVRNQIIAMHNGIFVTKIEGKFMSSNNQMHFLGLTELQVQIKQRYSEIQESIQDENMDFYNFQNILQKYPDDSKYFQEVSYQKINKKRDLQFNTKFSNSVRLAQNLKINYCHGDFCLINNLDHQMKTKDREEDIKYLNYHQQEGILRKQDMFKDYDQDKMPFQISSMIIMKARENIQSCIEVFKANKMKFQNQKDDNYLFLSKEKDYYMRQQKRQLVGVCYNCYYIYQFLAKNVQLSMYENNIQPKQSKPWIHTEMKVNRILQTTQSLQNFKLPSLTQKKEQQLTSMLTSQGFSRSKILTQTYVKTLKRKQTNVLQGLYDFMPKQDSLQTNYFTQKTFQKQIVYTLKKCYELEQSTKLQQQFEKVDFYFNLENQIFSEEIIYKMIQMQKQAMQQSNELLFHKGQNIQILPEQMISTPKMSLTQKKKNPFHSQSQDPKITLKDACKKLNIDTPNLDQYEDLIQYLVIDSLTAVPYLIIKSEKINRMNQIQLIVIAHDFFDDFTQRISFYKNLIQNINDIYIILFNYPGQAYTLFDEEIQYTGFYNAKIIDSNSQILTFKSDFIQNARIVIVFHKF